MKFELYKSFIYKNLIYRTTQEMAQDSALPAFELTFGSFAPDCVEMPMVEALPEATHIQEFVLEILRGFTDDCLPNALYIFFGDVLENPNANIYEVCTPNDADFEVSDVHFVECFLCGCGVWSGTGYVYKNRCEGHHFTCGAMEEEHLNQFI
jgi:hypothetical protein